MHSIDPQLNTERENYKLLTGSIIPRPVAFVTSESKEGTLNGAPFSYFNIVSSNPPMISLSIQKADGKQKDTARNILENKEFVIHIVDEENVEQINQTAASLSAYESEVDLAKLTHAKSEKVSVPGVREAKVRMECVLEKSLELGDKNNPGCDLLIGRVVQYHVIDDVYENGKIDPVNLSPVSRLAGHDYASIGDIFTKERPK